MKSHIFAPARKVLILASDSGFGMDTERVPLLEARQSLPWSRKICMASALARSSVDDPANPHFGSIGVDTGNSHHHEPLRHCFFSHTLLRHLFSNLRALASNYSLSTDARPLSPSFCFFAELDAGLRDWLLPLLSWDSFWTTVYLTHWCNKGKAWHCEQPTLAFRPGISSTRPQ